MQMNGCQISEGEVFVIETFKDSSAIAMKGDELYEVVIEGGKTCDDPLGKKDGRINLRQSKSASNFDISGVKSAPPRNRLDYSKCIIEQFKQRKSLNLNIVSHN